MGVTLKKRKNKDGTTTPFLDIFYKGNRRLEFLSNLKLVKGTTDFDRKRNKENWEIAKRIHLKKMQELAAGDYDIKSESGRKTDVVQWMQGYYDKYKKKDSRNILGVLNRFKAFLTEQKKTNITFGNLTESVITDFREYLTEHSKGEGAASYFARFKKMVREAYRKKVIHNNPAAEVKRPKGQAKEKAVLTREEIIKLAETPIENDQVRRAFLFSLMTGLRWVEVSTIKWEDVDLNNNIINVYQSKVDKDKAITLNDTAIKLLGKPGDDDLLIFDLPTANGANKSLKGWVKRAGIRKHITWHCARHSTGTNLILNGADSLTVQHLLGHSTLKYTPRYIRIAKELKQKATDSLNIDIETSKNKNNEPN